MASSSEQSEMGLYGKFHVARVDGRDQAGGDKENARYFVLDYVNDPLARWPLKEYADRAWRNGYKDLALDLWAQLRALGLNFRTIPEEEAEVQRNTEWVTKRLTELYGPDRDKWPQPPRGR